MSTLLDLDYSYVDKMLLPGVGRKYSGITSKGLIWLCNSAGNHFPNHYIRRTTTRRIILYCHGNGGTLGDFMPIVQYYYEWMNSSIFSIEYPSYGPAEGKASESSVNDNVRTAYNFLLNVLEYSPQDVVIMGYSIGSGPAIWLASELCSPSIASREAARPPAALITIAAFTSVKDIIRDRKDGGLVSMLGK